jgi:hypothetical protein
MKLQEFSQVLWNKDTDIKMRRLPGTGWKNPKIPLSEPSPK